MALQRSERDSAREVRQARRNLQRSLKAGSQQQVQEAGSTIEALMESIHIQEAWERISRWYWQAKGRQLLPSREVLGQVTTERVELYICRPTERIRFPFLVQPEEVDGGIPLEADIELEVGGLKGGRAGGLLDISAEDIMGWLREAKRKKEPVRRRWKLAVILIHLVFGDGTLLEDLS